WRDYYMPRTGRKDAYGNDVRISLPTYMKDVIAYSRHPALAFTHALNPFLSSLVDLWNNRDFYNTQIRGPDDTTVEALLADVRYLGSQGKPFFVTGMQKMAESDEPLSRQAAAFFGFMPASHQSTMTAAQQYFSDVMQQHMPEGARTQAQGEHAQLVNSVLHELRTGKINGEGELRARLYLSGDKTKAQQNEAIKRGLWSPMMYQASKVSLDEAFRGWKLATSGEQEQLAEIMVRKIEAAHKAKTIDETQVREYLRLLLPALQRAQARAARTPAGAGRSAMSLP